MACHCSSQPKGVRLGYMGHLTYIADETVKLLELYSQTSLLPMLYEFIEAEDWWNYVTKVLKETKERDAQVLGGTRPNMMESHKALDDVHDDDFLDEHGEEYGSASGFLSGDGVIGLERDVASDQVRLCHSCDFLLSFTLSKTAQGPLLLRAMRIDAHANTTKKYPILPPFSIFLTFKSLRAI